MILAGNAIAKFPYKWGGGHGAWRDNGYDCSGSVSFALAAAGLLEPAARPPGCSCATGGKGPGDWITIYANDGHVFMVVAGPALRHQRPRPRRHPLAGGGASRSPASAIHHIPGL